MPAADRLAGCLVLLYGQQPRSIVGLRRADLDIGGAVTTLRLGAEAVDLIEPLAGVARAVAGGPGHGRWAGNPTVPTPGAVHGCTGPRPGYGVGSTALLRRLARYGISVPAARNTALPALSRDVPTRVLAELLGVSTATLERWRGLSGGSWASYAPRGGYRKAYRPESDDG